jgi:hypothetical protein
VLLGALGLRGSLLATYYSGSGSSVTASPVSIDFSVASGGVFQTFTATFSARYAGSIALSAAGVYTFKIKNVGSADRFLLNVQNKVLINMLSLAPAANADTTATIKLPLSCGVFDVALQYVCTSTAVGRGITLSVVENGVYVVPQLSMWYSAHVIASLPIVVAGGPVCGTRSTVVAYATSASILTAGIPSSFTIQAVDCWGNTLSTADDVFAFAVAPYFTHDTVTRPVFSSHPPAATSASQLNIHDAFSDDYSLTTPAMVAALGSGAYAVSYTVTKSGWYFIRGRLLQPGGLYAVYTESTLLVEGGLSFDAQPAAQRIDPVVNFDWGSTSPLDDWSSGPLCVSIQIVLCV